MATKAPRFITQTTIKDNTATTGEYLVRAYDQHGTRFQSADYHTDCPDDAAATSIRMRKDGQHRFQAWEDTQPPRVAEIKSMQRVQSLQSMTIQQVVFAIRERTSLYSVDTLHNMTWTRLCDRYNKYVK